MTELSWKPEETIFVLLPEGGELKTHGHVLANSAALVEHGGEWLVVHLPSGVVIGGFDKKGHALRRSSPIESACQLSA